MTIGEENGLVKPDAASIGRRLRAEIGRLGLPAQNAAEIIGVSKSTLYNWYDSAQFSALQLVTLASIGIDIDFVLFGSPTRVTARYGARVTVHSNTEQPIEIDPSDYVYVPVFDVSFGAGPGRTINFDEPPLAYDAYRRAWVRERQLLGAALFKASIKGDSMWPILQDGQCELFNASIRTIRSGEIYGIRIGDEHIAKYLRNLPGGMVEISSHNPDPKHAAFTVRAEEFGNGIEIVGALVR